MHAADTIRGPQRPVLWVTRPDGRRQNLALPRSAASPIRVRYW